MGDANFAVADCPSCGKRSFVVWKDKKVGRDEFKGRCLACDIKKDMQLY